MLSSNSLKSGSRFCRLWSCLHNQHMNRQLQSDHFVAQAHQLAVQRLREHSQRMGDAKAQLARWRTQSGPTQSVTYWAEWGDLLAGSVDALAIVVCANTDHATVLSSVSPMSVLITQAERAQLLDQSRSLGGRRNVGCKLTAAVYFSPISCQISRYPARNHQKLSSLGPIFAQMPPAAQAPRRLA